MVPFQNRSVGICSVTVPVRGFSGLLTVPFQYRIYLPCRADAEAQGSLIGPVPYMVAWLDRGLAMMKGLAGRLLVFAIVAVAVVLIVGPAFRRAFW